MNRSFWESSASLESKEGRLTLVALIMMLYVIAVFIAVAIHEVLGHGLATALFGGEFYAVFISPGSGFISFYLPETLSASQVAFIYMAGILVQFMIGLAVFFLVLPRIKNFMAGLFALMFSVAMLVHPAMYLFLGYFYESGDTRYAVALLGMQPDAFIVAGLILTGVFVMMISLSAVNFLGRHIEMGDEAAAKHILTIFWLPPMLLSGFGALISSFFQAADQVSYSLLSAAIILLLLGVAIYLVPVFAEPRKEYNKGMSMKSVFSVLLVFAMLLLVWVGAFGVSQETAHGILLHDPPVEVEQYYSDYTVGNAEIIIFSNGTARVDIILRNQQESPSPMEERIYHSFDSRPDWERYISRSRNMIITMFDLQREVGENLSFSTGYGTARALGFEDDLGRKCTTYLSVVSPGTRQEIVMTSDETIFQPSTGQGGGTITMSFIDPWHNRGGYLDEVRISWDTELEYKSSLAYNDLDPDIDFNRGNVFNDTIGWKNINHDDSPSEYRIVLEIVE